MIFLGVSYVQCWDERKIERRRKKEEKKERK